MTILLLDTCQKDIKTLVYPYGEGEALFVSSLEGGGIHWKLAKFIKNFQQNF